MQERQLKIAPIMRKVQAIRDYINECVLERESETDSAMLAVMSGQSCLLLGDAGAAKTLQIQLMMNLMGLRLFDTLMSESTKPEAIFGPTDVPALAQGIQRVKTEGYAPTAHGIFLDEVFKASGVILNPLLWLLNEHKFRNGDEGVITCPTLAVFGASNEIPQDASSRPIYDRFLIRHKVEYIRSTQNLHKLFTRATSKTKVDEPEHLTLEEVMYMRDVVKRVHMPSEIWGALIKTRDQVKRAVGIEISDRRLVKCISVIQAHALLRNRKEVVLEDLDVLANLFWDNPDQIKKVRSIVVANSGSITGDLISYVETAESIFNQALKSGDLRSGLKKLKEVLQVTKQFSTQNGTAIHRSVYDFAYRIKGMLDQRKDFIITILLNENSKPWFKLSDVSAQSWTAEQLRSVGFKYKRTMGYWWIEHDPKMTQEILTSKCTKKLNVLPKFVKLI